jgi:hypothetical protein
MLLIRNETTGALEQLEALYQDIAVSRYVVQKRNRFCYSGQPADLALCDKVDLKIHIKSKQARE